jgi:signal transduction histidine kinase
MNGVLGMTELLLEMNLTKEQRECVEIIHRSGETLLTILNDILDFSKIEAGRLELETIDFNLQEAIEDVITLFAPVQQPNNLNWSVSSRSEDWKFKAICTGCAKYFPI